MLQSEFQGIQGYTEKPCLKKQNKTKKFGLIATVFDTFKSHNSREGYPGNIYL